MYIIWSPKIVPPPRGGVNIIGRWIWEVHYLPYNIINRVEYITCRLEAERPDAREQSLLPCCRSLLNVSSEGMVLDLIHTIRNCLTTRKERVWSPDVQKRRLPDPFHRTDPRGGKKPSYQNQPHPTAGFGCVVRGRRVIVLGDAEEGIQPEPFSHQTSKKNRTFLHCIAF